MNNHILKKNLKRLILPILFLFQTIIGITQTSLKQIDLEYGIYNVGFNHYITLDSTRTYSRIYDYTNKKIARPIPVSIWFPSPPGAIIEEPLTVLDYLEILKDEEEWEHLPNKQILNWFYYPNTPANQRHLTEQAHASVAVEDAEGKFPVIVYAPSYQASSIENFALCEYLASHGFVVLSCPSRGTETRWFSRNSAMEMETQARDVEFLIKEAGKFKIADYDQIAVMGFSFGGLANIIAQNRNDRIKAMVSLDGTERYQFKLLGQSPFFDAKKVDVPYFHMAQKEIPEKVLREENIDPELNTQFQLFDSITNGVAYRVRFHNLTHSHFSTLGVLFANRDPKQDKSDAEIMESYKLVAIYTLHFLRAILLEDDKALNYMENTLLANGINKDLITQKNSQPPKDAFTFQDFNDLASSQNYKNLVELYDSIANKQPSFEIPESAINTLGLQLVFNPKRSWQGINVFLLATKLFPNSANLYDSLAEGYLFMGDTEKAINSFEKSLELNSQNQNAIMRLEQLRE